MAELRKAALWMLALLVAVLAGDRAASAVLRRPLMCSGFRFSRALRSGVDAGVVVLGDSRGVTSIDVAEVERFSGMRTFSLAYNGMPLSASEELLLDYLDRNRPPRLAVIEVTSAVESPAFIAELRTYADLSPRIAALYAGEHPVAARAGHLFTLLHYDSEIYLRALYYVRRSDQDWTNRASMSPQDVQRVAQMPPATLQPRPENVAALQRMIALLESRGSAVRLLIGPYLPEYAARSNAGAFAAFIAARAQNVDPKLRVWNYAASVGGPSNFGDVLHLNEAGAKQFAAILQRDGFFGQ